MKWHVFKGRCKSCRQVLNVLSSPPLPLWQTGFLRTFEKIGFFLSFFDMYMKRSRIVQIPITGPNEHIFSSKYIFFRFRTFCIVFSFLKYTYFSCGLGVPGWPPLPFTDRSVTFRCFFTPKQICIFYMDRYYKYIDAVSLSASRINDINIFLREPDKSRMMFQIFGMTRGDKDARKIV